MSPNSHWYCKLLCYYTIIDTWYSNLAYYHTTIDSASSPINSRYLDTKLNPLLYYNWYSNLWNNTLDPTINYPNIHDSIQLSLRYDTWYNYQYTYTPLDIYPYAIILDTTTSTITIHQGFSKLSYVLMILWIQHQPAIFYNWYNNLNTMIPLIQQQLILLYITWYHTRYAIWIHKLIAILPRTRRPPARCGRTPTDAHTRSG